MRTTLPLLVLLLGLGTTLLGANAPESEDHHPLFDRIDTNHDGVISLAEFEAFRAEHRRHERGGAAGAPGAAAPGSSLTMNGLAHGGTPPATVGASTTPPAAATTPVPPAGAGREGRHPLFDRIDTNHDGVISLAEWIVFREQMRHHKKKGDATAPVVPGPVLPPQTPPTTPAIATPPTTSH